MPSPCYDQYTHNTCSRKYVCAEALKMCWWLSFDHRPLQEPLFEVIKSCFVFQMHPLSELIWRRLPDMPRAMEWPQSVTMDTAVYIADRGSRIIRKYDLQTEEWTKLSQYQCWCFTMTEHNHQLTVVGGHDVSTVRTSNTVAVFSTSQRSWKQPYPPMNTPRRWPAVSTYNQHLVVAGGCDARWTDLATVEILNTSTHHSQWLSATPLPVRCRLMSAAIIHSTLYLLGGTLGKRVLSMSISEKLVAQWHTLPDAPLKHSTAIAVHGSLLAVGGRHGRQRSSAIHFYDQEKNTWNKVGDLPNEQAYCACCLLPSGEILVAGGEVSEYNWISRMDVAFVKN